MEEVFLKFPSGSIIRKEGEVGDLVIIVTKADSSEVTTPMDLSLPIEAFIGTLLRDDGEEVTLAGGIRLDLNDKGYRVTDTNYDIISSAPAWKLDGRYLNYLSENYSAVIMKNRKLREEEIFIL